MISVSITIQRDRNLKMIHLAQPHPLIWLHIPFQTIWIKHGTAIENQSLNGRNYTKRILYIYGKLVVRVVTVLTNLNIDSKLVRNSLIILSMSLPYYPGHVDDNPLFVFSRFTSYFISAMAPSALIFCIMVSITVGKDICDDFSVNHMEIIKCNNMGRKLLKVVRLQKDPGVDSLYVESFLHGLMPTISRTLGIPVTVRNSSLAFEEESYDYSELFSRLGTMFNVREAQRNKTLIYDGQEFAIITCTRTKDM